MTLIHFKYSDSYRQPSRGSLAFMPHRRHAANETEVLPKPFTVSLDNGEARVNLEPNTESWVWIVTEYFGSDSVSRYYTVPEQDGVIEHTELIEISPSSLPAAYDAVEPVWWAEIREYRRVVGNNLIQSGQAIGRAEKAVEVAEKAVEESQHNQSLALAYRNESRQHSYDSREARDGAREAEYNATHGPNNAADRAEAARDETIAARDETIAARDETITARDETITARDETTAARDETTAARDETTAAQQAAEAARDEATTGPNNAADRSEAAQQAAEAARDESVAASESASTSAGDAQAHAATAANQADRAHDEANRAETLANDMVFTQWKPLPLINGWSAAINPHYRLTPMGIQFRGAINGTNATGAQFAEIPLSEARFTIDGIHIVASSNPATFSRINTIKYTGALFCYTGVGHDRTFLLFTAPSSPPLDS